jgi:hypothetical protein
VGDADGGRGLRGHGPGGYQNQGRRSSSHLEDDLREIPRAQNSKSL